MTSRDEGRGLAAVDLLRRDYGLRNIVAAVLDLEDPQSIVTFCRQCLKAYGEPSLLVNNAGLCLPGNDPGTYTRSLAANCLGPWWMAQGLGLIPEGPLSVQGARRWHRGIVINVSSGDGELVCLHSALATAFRGCDDPSDVLALVSQSKCKFSLLARPRDPRMLRRADGSLAGTLWSLLDQGVEVAVGPTPAYAVSKAALNALTRTSPAGGSLVVAVCPGDVTGTAMHNYVASSSNSWDRSPSEAAHDVLWVIEEAAALSMVQHGKFYRFREPIAF